METILALHRKEAQGSFVKLALESGSNILAATPPRVISNGYDLLCVCEGLCCFLYFLVDRKLILLGTYLFRCSGNTQVLSVIVDEDVKNFTESYRAHTAVAGGEDILRFSADGEVNFVAFIGDALLIGSSAGFLGTLFVSSDRRCVRGKSTRVQERCGVHWCLRYDSKQCVCISSDTVTVVSIVPESRDAICYRRDSVHDAVASVGASQTMSGCFFLAHKNLRALTVLHGSPDETLQSETFPLFSEEWGRCVDARQGIPNVYAYGCSDACLLAVVYPDAVSFTAWNGHALVSTAVVTNELTIPFMLALWKSTAEGARLLVMRSDSRCLMYDVVMSKRFSGIEEIVAAHQVTLPSYMACLMGGGDTGVLLCWPSGTLLASHTALLQCSADEEKFEAIEVHGIVNYSPNSDSVLLLEVIPMRGSHGVVCLYSTGECRLSLYNNTGTILLALEEHPYDATSCLAFEDSSGGYYCVLGFSDGDIRLFLGAEMRANIRATHCGAVDRLLKLPKMNEADETSFLSISTVMGTVCFHTEENASVSRTMCSPSKPLTAYFLDPELEFALLFSGTVANLWHIPTGLLERVLRSPQEQLDPRLVNLLEPYWASPTCTARFRFLGQAHYAICTNVDSLVSGLISTQESSHRLTSEYSCALGLLLHFLGETCPASITRGDDLWEALDDLGLVAAGVQTQECVWSAILLLCGLLSHTSDGICGAEIYCLIESLSDKLACSVAPDLHRQVDVMQLFLSRFYTLQRSTPAAFRHALRLLVTKMPASRLADVVNLLQSRELAAQSRQAREGEIPGAPSHAYSENLLASLLIVSSLASQRGDFSLQSDTGLCSFLHNRIVEVQHGVTVAIEDDDNLLRWSAALLGSVESYPIVCVLDEKNLFSGLMKALVKKAFGARGGEAHQVTLEALQRLIAQDPQDFLCNYIVEDFHLNVAYRPYIIVFLAHFVKSFPYEAYSVFSTIADIFVSGLTNLGSGNKSAASIYHVAVKQLLRVANTYLPNVSLQQSLRHLAVGGGDGKVMVYSVEGASIVTAFKAHSAPVLGVAYSSNITTLDIATVSEALDKIKVWRSPGQPSDIATFFRGSGATNFKLVTSMDLPLIDLRGEGMSLLIKLFQLHWLSPQCVEFSSPWHGRVLVSLP
ncbi:hypothetical protein JKF63_06037 [Porcisia hertigi]|uniref:DUF7048 domain-containing protein n=1 Tax=Porcisia hertigi TaxID=2761500 RepID=A0A836I799_9TRYP|nr:hypothetical protein JKF63_06037 [Porcisia hertigi]